jgi:uncharacterized protein (DUF849 family)
MKAINRLAVIFLPVLIGCVYVSPQLTKTPDKVVPHPPERARVRTGVPLIIEVALLPAPGASISREAPASRREYIEEIKTCARIGATIVRLQPLAAGSSAADYRFDRSLNNYRALLRDVLAAAPDVIIDCDLGGVEQGVEEWVRCNKRIELDSTREEDNPVTVAVGPSALGIMRETIDEGGGVRLGLHDSSAWPYKGKPTNLDYLRQAVSLARAAGRPIATPAEARRMLGLPRLAKVYAVPSCERVARGSAFSLDAIVGPIDDPFRAYGVIVTPSGRRFSFIKKGQLVPGIRAFTGRRKGLKTVSCVPLVDTVIGPRIPSGVYKIYLGLFPRHGRPIPRRAFAIASAEVIVE